MTAALTPAQMHVRLLNLLPLDIAANISRHGVGEQVQIAWDNDWRDPEWLAKVALEGTAMGNVRNPAALFMDNLKAAAATGCPVEQTPTPPRELDRAPGWNPPATESQRAHWLDVARAGLVAARTGQQAPSWVPGADVDWSFNREEVEA